MLSVTLPVSPTTPQGSKGETVTPLLLCMLTVAEDSDNKSVTHPAPGLRLFSALAQSRKKWRDTVLL